MDAMVKSEPKNHTGSTSFQLKKDFLKSVHPDKNFENDQNNTTVLWSYFYSTGRSLRANWTWSSESTTLRLDMDKNLVHQSLRNVRRTTEEKESIKLQTAKTTKKEPRGSVINIEPITQTNVELIANVDDQIQESSKTTVPKTVKTKDKATEDKKAVNIRKTNTTKKSNKSNTTTITKNVNIKPTKANVEDVRKSSNNTDESLVNIDVTAGHATNNNKELDPYIYCKYCNKKYLDNIELQKHLQFHDPSRDYECEFLRYANLQILKKQSNKHTKVQTFPCKVCDKLFYYSSKLKAHLRTHTGEKPYACDICDYKCSLSSRLKQHRRTHTGDKPYACEICDYKCFEHGNLKSHLRTHSGEKPYACDICDYKCSQRINLKTHLRTHSGDKPYACDICDYKCSANVLLKRHRRMHTGEKP